MSKVQNITGEEVKAPSPEDGSAPATPYDSQLAHEYAFKLEGFQTRIDAIAADAAKKKAPHTEKMKELRKEAADKGISRAVLNHVLDERKSERKVQASFDRLNEENKAQAKQLSFDMQTTDRQNEAA